MQHVSEVLRELLRRLYMGKRNLRYWQSLKDAELRRYGYQKKRIPAGKR